MPLRGVSRPAGQNRQALHETFEQEQGVEDLHPRCGELERERKPVEPAADVADSRLEPHVPPHLPRPREEELDRLVPRERLEHELLLAGDAKANPARHQELHVRRRREQRSHVVRRGDQVLRVVEQEKRLRLTEILQVADTGELRDRCRDERRVLNRRKRNEEGAVAEVVGKFRDDLHRQARLSAPTRAGDRHETRPVCEQLPQLRELTLATDERRRGDGKICRGASS